MCGDYSVCVKYIAFSGDRVVQADVRTQGEKVCKVLKVLELNSIRKRWFAFQLLLYFRRNCATESLVGMASTSST